MVHREGLKTTIVVNKVRCRRRSVHLAQVAARSTFWKRAFFFLLATICRRDVHTVDGDDVHHDPVRNLSAISDMLAASGLPAEVKERSIQVFTALGEAEAKTHGSTLDQVC